MCRCGTSAHGLVGMVVLGGWLDLMILEVSSNLNDSIILCFLSLPLSVFRDNHQGEESRKVFFLPCTTSWALRNTSVLQHTQPRPREGEKPGLEESGRWFFGERPAAGETYPAEPRTRPFPIQAWPDNPPGSPSPVSLLGPSPGAPIGRKTAGERPVPCSGGRCTWGSPSWPFCTHKPQGNPRFGRRPVPEEQRLGGGLRAAERTAAGPAPWPRASPPGLSPRARDGTSRNGELKFAI